MPAMTHPGTITFINGDTNEVISVKPAADLPETMRFATTHDGAVPVVKVVMRTMDKDSREIVDYGPNGEFLRSTIQIRDKA